MNFENIIYEKQNGVATITLNRPQALNTFTPQMNGELQQALKDADEDKSVRCLLLALACDLRVASEEAKFIQAFARVGLAPDCGGSIILPRLVGLSKAMELLLLAEPVDAREALRIGLVTKVVPANDLVNTAREIAGRVARGPRSIGLIKRAVNRAILPELEAQLEYEAYLQEIAGRSADFDEGVHAFLEKRAPVFTGK